MSRYFERADNCARAIEATHSLMLSRGEFAHDQRWYRALTVLGLPADARDQDPQLAIGRLAADRQTTSSIVSCIAGARENASQVREEISSEMWEQLNRLFHEVAQSEVDPQDAAAVMRLVALVREGSYSFYGATETTMSHGEGWRFVQLGKFTERACAVSMLLDAYFSTPTKADDLDWVTLLASCAAFESYCRVFTADLQPDRIAKFLLVHPGVPVLGPLRGRADARVARSDRREFDRAQARADRADHRPAARVAGLHADVGADGRRSARVSERCARAVRRAAPRRARGVYRLSRSRWRSKADVLRHPPPDALPLQPARSGRA